MAQATGIKAIVDDIMEQAPEQVTLLRKVASDQASAQARGNGLNAFLARHEVAKHMQASLTRNKDLLKGIKKVNEQVATGIGIAMSTLSNFKRVSELDVVQATESFHVLGLQGTIDTCKAFHFLTPASVNSICQGVAKELDEKPIQAANRHLLKVAEAGLNEDLTQALPEVVRAAFEQVLTIPAQIEADYKTETVDYKAECRKLAKRIAELEAEVASLRGEALPEAEVHTEAEVLTEA